MGVNVESPSEPADDADEDEHVDLEDVEGEGDAEAGGEDGDEGVDLAQPHRDQPEEDGADNRGEEPAPVVPHREEHGCYLKWREDIMNITLYRPRLKGGFQVA